MSRRGWTLLGGLVAVVLVGYYTWWFYTHFELREREERLDVSMAARRNPLLAAERFLRRLGRETESVSGRDRLLRLPPPGDVLLVKRFSAGLPPDREEALVEWLRQGGHLIVSADEAWDEESQEGGNRFLLRFGVRLHEDPDETQEGKVDSEPGPAAVTMDSDAPAMDVAFDRGRRLEDRESAAVLAVGEGKRIHLLQYEVGSGALTVLSDNRFLHNDHIGEGDHALFLASLVDQGGKVWLLYSSDMPSLFTLLWRTQPYLVMSALLLVPLWLRWLAGFTGPRRPLLVGSGRRNLLEHLDAAATFSWRTDRSQQVLARSRENLVREWLQRHHRLEQMARHERCSWIAAHSGLARREVDAALHGEARNEQDFIRISAAQQRLLAVMNRRKERE